MIPMPETLTEKGYHTELLAPAGSFDAARAAVNAGADAIYMGGPLFSARAYAESSSAPQEGPDMLMQSIEYCRLRGVRVFMTLNTLMKEKEMEGLEAYLEPYVAAGLDGVIVQDAGVMRRVREHYPELSLHISTQAAVTGPRYAARLKKIGADRVVLARELSLEEIRRIYDETGMEIEVFAHGALCYAYSGQCLMSSMIGGRSGNRGRCAGTCRLPYDLYDEEGRRLNRQDRRYLLSMKDLCTVSRLRGMIEAGVYSFKIEGRMKSPVYVAAVTSVYRKYLDLAMEELRGEPLPAQSVALKTPGKAASVSAAPERMPSVLPEEADLRLLMEGFERGGMSDGYLDGKKGPDMITLFEKPEFKIHDEAVIREIKERYIDTDRKVPVSGKITIRIGQPVTLSLWHVGHGAETVLGYVKAVKGADESGDRKDTANAGKTGKGADISEVHKGSDVPEAGIASAAVETRKDPAVTEVTVRSDFITGQASNRPATESDVREKAGRFGGTDFELVELDVDLEEGCFVPVKVLNDVRREAIEELRRRLITRRQ